MTYYCILGLRPDASRGQVEQMHGLLLSKLGNGIAEEEKQDAAELYRIIEEAYAVLSDDARRSGYDKAPMEVEISEQLANKLWNLHDLFYHVDIPNGKINWLGADIAGFSNPYVCTCCMSEKVSASVMTKCAWTGIENLMIVRRLKWEFPLCGDCEDHTSDIKSKFFRITILPAAIACVVAIILRFLMNDDARVLVSTVLLPVLSVGLFLWMGLSTRIQIGSLSRSSHGHPVRMTHFDHIKISFDFTNRIYAERFAAANSGTIQWYYRKKKPNSVAFLSGYEGVAAAVWAWIGWTVLAVILSVLIVPYDRIG